MRDGCVGRIGVHVELVEGLDREWKENEMGVLKWRGCERWEREKDMCVGG